MIWLSELGEFLVCFIQPRSLHRAGGLGTCLRGLSALLIMLLVAACETQHQQMGYMPTVHIHASEPQHTDQYGNVIDDQ
jgi:hypothetical protein